MKNDILARLYHGTVEPILGNVFIEVNRHKVELQAMETAEKKLKSTFSKQQDGLYDDLNAAQSEINTVIEDAAFAEGFRLGLQLATATYYKNDDTLIKKWSSFFMEEDQNEKNA